REAALSRTTSCRSSPNARVSSKTASVRSSSSSRARTPVGRTRPGSASSADSFLLRRDPIIAIRDLRNDETPFLREMLYTALAWRPGVELPPREWVLEHEQVAPFHSGWGRRGDTGLVADEDGASVGLVWYRFFTDDEHGEGFVDEETPEVAVAVV